MNSAEIRIVKSPATCSTSAPSTCLWFEEIAGDKNRLSIMVVSHGEDIFERFDASSSNARRGRAQPAGHHPDLPIAGWHKRNDATVVPQWR